MAKARWMARASVELNTPMPKIKGRGRCVPELKKGPDQRYEKEDFFRDSAGWIPGTSIRLGNHLLKLLLGFHAICRFGHCDDSLLKGLMILIGTLTASFLPEERLKNTTQSALYWDVGKVRRLNGTLLLSVYTYIKPASL